MAHDTDEPPMTSDELSRSYAVLVGESPSPTIAPNAEDATPPPPERILEALFFVGGPPLTAQRACGIIRGLKPEQFDEMVAQLNANYRRQARPYVIQSHAQGWALTLKPRYRHVITKLYGGVREARLSSGAVDVLALVAYRQPVTKDEVESLRGADSGPLLRQLVRRGLIQVGALPAETQLRYSTTPRFLEMFELQSLDDLPKTHDLQQL